jgi:hypothetical protein
VIFVGVAGEFIPATQKHHRNFSIRVIGIIRPIRVRAVDVVAVPILQFPCAIRLRSVPPLLSKRKHLLRLGANDF